jgi:gliding motility-associated-like protein
MQKKYLFVTYLLFVAGARILIAQCPITVDAGDDIYLCAPPVPTQLDGSIDGAYLNFFWTPTTGMSGANTLNPTVSVTQTRTFVLTARAVNLNNNLITNGDFEGGNFGFTSDYVESPGNLVPEGVYEVLDNPQNSHPGFQPCDDHTSGSGNMMAVNGAGTPNLNVWCQTVSVMPNTQYAFSAWVATLVAASPALLQFNINGSPLGPVFAAPNQTCVWQNFYSTWNSGNNTSATICIVNQNTTLGGNDFALDDLAFAPVCQVSDSVTVHVVDITAVANPPIAFIPCAGAQFTLSGAGSSTGPNITYQWDTPNGNIVSGANTLSPVIDQAGAYTLTVTFDNGLVNCTKTASVSVSESPNPLFAWIMPSGILGCNAPTITLIGNSNQPAFSSYSWTTIDGNIVSGANAKNAVIDEPGIYALVVTNTSTGCTTQAEITVTAATDPPTASAFATDTIFNCQSSTLGLDGNASTQGNNITYAWAAFNGGNVLSGANQDSAVANAPGLYVLTVTNTVNGCIDTDSVQVISDLQPPQVVIQTPDTFNCGLDTLILSGSADSNYLSVQWSAFNGGSFTGDSTLLQLTILSPGQYILGVIGANHCYGGDTVLVTIDTIPPVATIASPDTITCQNPAVELSGAGSSGGPAFTYQWSASGGGNIVSGDTTLTPLVNAAGFYTLAVTDRSNLCSASATIPVSADTNAIVAVANAPDTLTCLTNQVSLNINGSNSGPSFTYSWTTSNGLILSGADTPNPIVGAPGTYQLLLTNTANGCSATDLAVAIQNLTTPDLAIAAPAPLTCSAPTQVLTGQNAGPSGPYRYLWVASNGGNILTGDSTLTPTVDAPGQYTLYAVHLKSGCADTVSADVIVAPGTPAAIVAAPDTLTCTAPDQSLNGASSSTGPDFRYQWTAAAGGNILSGDTTLSPLISSAGWYYLLVRNIATGCTATDSIFVSASLNYPPADAGVPGLLTCNQTVFLLTANPGIPAGNLQFHWSALQGGNFISDPNTIQVACDVAGLYSVVVTDPSNGCTASDTVTVNSNQAPPTLQINTPDTLDCTLNNQLLQAIASGSGSTLTFEWETFGGQIASGDDTAEPLINAPGIYVVTVTNADNGCTAAQSVEVVQDTLSPDILINVPQILTCSQPQVSLTGSASPAAPVSFTWTSTNGLILSGGNTAAPTIGAPGTYTLTATLLRNGCTAQASTVVGQNTTPPLVEAGVADTLDCSITFLQLSGSASGQGNLQIIWTAGPGGNILSGANSFTPQINAAGFYVMQATDAANGCIATDTVRIFNDANTPIADAGLPDTLNCTIQQISLQGAGSAGPGITYSWTAGSGGNIVSGNATLTPVVNAPGVYQLQITNQNNGCTALSSVTIARDITAPTVDAGPGAMLTCSQTSLQLNGSASAPGNQLQYNWSTSNGNILNGGATLSPQINRTGQYILTVTNLLNGCTASDPVTVSIDTLSPVLTAAAPQELNCLLTQTNISAGVLQPLSNYSLQWTTGNGSILSGANSLNPLVDAPGSYLLSVQNLQNGCSATLSIQVFEDVAPPTAIAAAPNLLTCAQPQVNLSGTGSSAGAGFIYLWTAGPGGLITGGGTTLSPQVAAPGVYRLLVTNTDNGCTATTQVTLSQDTTAPTIAIAPPLLLTCERDTVAVNASASSQGPSYQYAWTALSGHIAGGNSTLILSVDQPGAYRLLITNQTNGCTASATANVGEDRALPQVNAGPDQILHCNQTSVTLQGSASAPVVPNYTWTTANGQILQGASTPSPVVNAAGLYRLTVANPANGCTASDEVVVTEAPAPAIRDTIQQPDCFRNRGVIQVSASGAGPFSFSADGGASYQSEALFSNRSPGNYTLVVRDQYGCTASETVTVNPPFVPQLELPDWLVISLGDSIRLEPSTNIPAGQVAEWMWSPSEGLSCDDCERPWAEPFRSSRYQLTVTDLNGCTAQASVTLQVDRSRVVYPPNVFSPNGDGLNDRFTIYGRAVTEIKLLQVFDRWGNQLFLGERLTPGEEGQGWDGTYRGQDMSPGVYVWMAVIVFVDGEEAVLSGDISIVR